MAVEERGPRMVGFEDYEFLKDDRLWAPNVHPGADVALVAKFEGIDRSMALQLGWFGLYFPAHVRSGERKPPTFDYHVRLQLSDGRHYPVLGAAMDEEAMLRELDRQFICPDGTQRNLASGFLLRAVGGQQPPIAELITASQPMLVSAGT